MYNVLRLKLLNIGFREVIGTSRFESEICTVEIDRMTLMIFKIVYVGGKEEYVPTTIDTLKKELDVWEANEYGI